MDLQLGVAQQQQVVEVSASAATLETTSTALVAVVGTKTVADLPMNGRDFRQMIKLAPGVSPASTSVNGMRTSGNNYQIDGADNNDAFQNAAAVNQGGVAGIAGTLLPIEAIDQFAVQSNASAESGRNAGSSVNLVIKSGTNTLHGSAYYFNRNEALASRSPFQTAVSPKQVIRNNQFGFALECGFDEVEIDEARFARQPLEQWLQASAAISAAYQEVEGRTPIFARRRTAA